MVATQVYVAVPSQDTLVLPEIEIDESETDAAMPLTVITI